MNSRDSRDPTRVYVQLQFHRNFLSFFQPTEPIHGDVDDHRAWMMMMMVDGKYVETHTAADKSMWKK